MKTLFKMLILAITISMGQQAFAECGFKAVDVINASTFELKNSCQSLHQVLNFLNFDGKKKQPHFKLYFDKQVEVKVGNEIYPVHGYFDDELFEIRITTFDTPRGPDFTPFGLTWTPQQGTSYLLHEISHLVLSSYPKPTKTNHLWQEFFAYAVQIELMDQELKNQVLEQNKNLNAFESPADVNYTYYEMDPYAFGVKSYKSMKAWGGLSFLQKIITGELPYSLKSEAHP